LRSAYKTAIFVLLVDDIGAAESTVEVHLWSVLPSR